MGLAEFDDPLEGVALRFVPQPRIPRRDARFGRGTRHLDVDQSRAADGAAAEMHEMPVPGMAVDRRVLVHRRNHTPVFFPQVARPERVDHRHGGLARSMSKPCSLTFLAYQPWTSRTNCGSRSSRFSQVICFERDITPKANCTGSMSQ